MLNLCKEGALIEPLNVTISKQIDGNPFTTHGYLLLFTPTWPPPLGTFTTPWTVNTLIVHGHCSMSLENHTSFSFPSDETVVLFLLLF